MAVLENEFLKLKFFFPSSFDENLKLNESTRWSIFYGAFIQLEYLVDLFEIQREKIYVNEINVSNFPCVYSPFDNDKDEVLYNVILLRPNGAQVNSAMESKQKRKNIEIIRSSKTGEKETKKCIQTESDKKF